MVPSALCVRLYNFDIYPRRKHYIFASDEKRPIHLWTYCLGLFGVAPGLSYFCAQLSLMVDGTVSTLRPFA